MLRHFQTVEPFRCKRLLHGDTQNSERARTQQPTTELEPRTALNAYNESLHTCLSIYNSKKLYKKEKNATLYNVR